MPRCLDCNIYVMRHKQVVLTYEHCVVTCMCKNCVYMYTCVRICVCSHTASHVTKVTQVWHKDKDSNMRVTHQVVGGLYRTWLRFQCTFAFDLLLYKYTLSYSLVEMSFLKCHFYTATRANILLKSLNCLVLLAHVLNSTLGQLLSHD